MEIFVKDFSGTTGPRILKFGTNIRYDRLYCSDSFTCAPCGIGAKKSPMAQNFEISAPLWRIILPVRKTVFRVLSRES